MHAHTQHGSAEIGVNVVFFWGGGGGGGGLVLCIPHVHAGCIMTCRFTRQKHSTTFYSFTPHLAMLGAKGQTHMQVSPSSFHTQLNSGRSLAALH